MSKNENKQPLTDEGYFEYVICDAVIASEQGPAGPEYFWDCPLRFALNENKSEQSTLPKVLLTTVEIENGKYYQ